VRSTVVLTAPVIPIIGYCRVFVRQLVLLYVELHCLRLTSTCNPLRVSIHDRFIHLRPFPLVRLTNSMFNSNYEMLKRCMNDN